MDVAALQDERWAMATRTIAVGAVRRRGEPRERRDEGGSGLRAASPGQRRITRGWRSNGHATIGQNDACVNGGGVTVTDAVTWSASATSAGAICHRPRVGP